MRVRPVLHRPRLGACRVNRQRGRSRHSLSPGFARHRYDPAPDPTDDRVGESEGLLRPEFDDCDDYAEPRAWHKTWVSQAWMSLTFGLLGDRVQWHRRER